MRLSNVSEPECCSTIQKAALKAWQANVPDAAGAVAVCRQGNLMRHSAILQISLAEQAERDGGRACAEYCKVVAALRPDSCLNTNV